MKRYLYFVFVGIVLFLTSCSSDGEEIDSQKEEFGGLEVLAIYDNGTIVPDITISTVPNTKVLTTDNSGKAVFDDIPTGNYEIVASPSYSDETYTEIAVVKENQVEAVQVVVGPEPISESAVDMDLLLDHIYNELKTEFLFDASGYSHYWGDIGMDVVKIDFDPTSRYKDLDNYVFSPSGYLVFEVWAEHYRVIRLTNIGLDAILESDYTTEDNIDPSILESELRFLRALLYFNLIKLYGNPILVTTAKIDAEQPNTFVQGRLETYEQVTEDLKFAQEYLGSGLSNNRASKEAATALLGKVYLTMAGFPLQQADKYNLALQEFDKITESYTLEEEYSNVFSLQNEESNTEVIFSVDFEGAGNYGVYWGPLGVSLQDRLLLTNNFIDSFFEVGAEPSEPITFPLNTNDSRFYQNIASFSYVNNVVEDESTLENWRPYKFVKELEEPTEVNGESFDYPYLRMADVYLMIAEAENAINGPTDKAYNALNLVRRRAFGSLEYDLQTGLTQEEFKNAILKERRLELCFEGQFKDDLIRMNALEEEILNFNEQYPELSKDFQSHEYIWPIPQQEMDLNPNAVQNEGY